MPPLIPAPGPVTRSPLGHLGPLGRDPLQFLAQCARDHGDFVELRVLGRRVYLLSDPEAIESLLVRNSDAFRKSVTYRTPLMRRMFGDGVFTSEGDLWSQQRKLLHAWLHGERIAEYYRLLAEETENTLSLWSGGARRDIHDDLQSMTSASFGRFLIRDITPAELEALMLASSTVRGHFCRQFSPSAQLANLLPLPSTLRFHGIMKQLHACLQEHIVKRRRTQATDLRSDFLGHLLAHRDGHGEALPDRLIRDELITLFFAGSETTALVLSWACFLLAIHPQTCDRARHESQAHVDPRPATAMDAPRMPLLTNIVRETIRLYPPSWVIGREALRPCRIGDFECKRGDTFLVSQWVLHRHPRYFSRPEQFSPERWNDPAMCTLPRFAYFPFGGGPRVCPGRSFAELAAIQVLANVLRRYRMDLVDEAHVEPQASITLQPKAGIHAVVTPHRRAGRQPARPRN